MRSATINAWILAGLTCLNGCNGGPGAFLTKDANHSVRPQSAQELSTSAESRSESESASARTGHDAVAKSMDGGLAPADIVKTGGSDPPKRTKTGPIPQPVLTQVSHKLIGNSDHSDETITVDGQTYGIRLVDHDVDTSSTGQSPQEVPSGTNPANSSYEQDVSPIDAPFSMPPDIEDVLANVTDSDAILLNLPSALSMIGGDHPVVGFARWKVQEAYANLDQAQALWLPSIQTGFSFDRHDGNLQASNGEIVDINRGSFQYGLGAGAVGAGTTPLPGLSAQFHLADAIFQPAIAQKTAWATGHSEQAVFNQQLRDVALAYMKLLDAHQQLRILQEIRDRTATLSKITDDFADAGHGLREDADRMQTELTLIEGRIAEAREQVDVASAQLAYALSADAGQRIIPMDPTVVPLELVSMQTDMGSFISSGLAHRPELKELQALVAAACDRFQRQKYAPFVPSVLLGFSMGGFGGGTGNTLNNVDGRYDFDAVVTWEIRNFGLGERSARRRTKAQVQQAMFRKLRLMDDVAREISVAYTQVTHRRERMAITQTGIQWAQDSYDRNLSRIREGEGLPIEALQSVKALEASRLAYLDAVVAYNEAQFQLQWALGWQVSAPAEAR
jgi:outer membrane protein TolC